MCEACWCAAWARGGTNPPWPWLACGHSHAAQSPMAKMFSSRVDCSVGCTTSWLIRLVSRPAMSFRKSGAFTPAAHTTSSAGSTRPSARRTPPAWTSATLASVCTSTPSLRSRSEVVWDRRGGSAGSTRGAASMSVTLMSLSASTRSRPKATTCRVVRCNSAASSTPVAPAPMMATCSCSGRSGVAWAWARMQALTMREWKRSASAAHSSRMACSRTPGVPKSLLWLPTAITSVS